MKMGIGDAAVLFVRQMNGEVTDHASAGHEGPAVRQMEARGIRTDKGDLNRWIRATNSMLQSIRQKITGLMEWLTAVKEKLTAAQSPDLAQGPRLAPFLQCFRSAPIGGGNSVEHIVASLVPDTVAVLVQHIDSMLFGVPFPISFDIALQNEFSLEENIALARQFLFLICVVWK